MIVIQWKMPRGSRCGSRRIVTRTSFRNIAREYFRAKHF